LGIKRILNGLKISPLLREEPLWWLSASLDTVWKYNICAFRCLKNKRDFILS
jgi:hypothetical protein